MMGSEKSYSGCAFVLGAFFGWWSRIRSGPARRLGAHPWKLREKRHRGVPMTEISNAVEYLADAVNSAYQSTHVPGTDGGAQIHIVGTIGECAMGLHRIADALGRIASVMEGEDE